jgi:hypothetical protein
MLDEWVTGLSALPNRNQGEDRRLDALRSQQSVQRGQCVER